MTPPHPSLQAFPKGISIIGTGKLGSSLAVHLHQRGYRIRSLYNRSKESCQKLAGEVDCELAGTRPADYEELGDLVFFALPDDVISPYVSELAPVLGEGNKPAWVHTSGAMLSDVLAPLAGNSHGAVAFHPVQTFNGQNRETAFRNCFVTLEGTEALCQDLKPLIRALGARPLMVSSEQKQAIHLAAVFVSNFHVTLFSGARAILKKQDVGVRTRELFGAIAEQTLQALLQHPPRDVLTGPVLRGDVSSMEKHLHILKGIPEWDSVYRELSKATLALARELPDRESQNDDAIQNLLR